MFLAMYKSQANDLTHISDGQVACYPRNLAYKDQSAYYGSQFGTSLPAGLLLLIA